MSAPSFFEGPEKKLELVVTPDTPSLRTLPKEAWVEVVAAAGAEILSVLRNQHCDAYLLSESSLFVFDDYCVMMTCGVTTLIDAIECLLRMLSVDSVAFLVYERKNEHFPERQPTSFHEDARRLQGLIPGRAFRFGDEHGHYVQLFHSTKEFLPEKNDPTVEVLMHGIDHEVAGRFSKRHSSGARASLRELGLESVLDGFEVSEHFFEPAGYSVNALRGEEYYTVHVTPERVGSYVSFETNYDFRGTLSALVASLVATFRPRAFDVVTFIPDSQADLEVVGYLLGDHVVHDLGPYKVTYLQYYDPPTESREPYELGL